MFALKIALIFLNILMVIQLLHHNLSCAVLLIVFRSTLPIIKLVIMCFFTFDKSFKGYKSWSGVKIYSLLKCLHGYVEHVFCVYVVHKLEAYLEPCQTYGGAFFRSPCETVNYFRKKAS